MPKPPEPLEPPIHVAARTGDHAELDRLVRGGADVNTRRDLEVDNGSHLRGLTPLMVAARSIDGATVVTLKWLLDKGADLSARSEAGETAAYYAAGKGGRWDFHPWRVVPDHADRLRYLLDAGLDVNETNRVGCSLLAEACKAGDPARVRLLLARGALLTGSPDVEPRREGTALDFLREHAPAGVSEEELEAMAEHLPPGNPGGRDSFVIPLFCAATSGSAECVRALLDAGADLRERDGEGKAALMYAGSPGVVDVLVDAGADSNERTSDGDDVLAVLFSGAGCSGDRCGPGRFDVIRAVIARGGRLEQSGTRFKRKRLYDAAFRHDADGVSFLLSLGCLADQAGEDGRTALHAICWQGEYADPATSAQCERIIRTLVEAGADVNAADNRGCTPLHEAAGGDWGNETAVRTLLALGAAPDSVMHHGCTPLMIAASEGRAETVRLLLAAGADQRREDADGSTAGMLAMQHLQTWQVIVLRPPEAHAFAGSAEEQCARHLEALRKAEECDALFDWPLRPGGAG